jgi:hypothetical protein
LRRIAEIAHGNAGWQARVVQWRDGVLLEPSTAKIKPRTIPEAAVPSRRPSEWALRQRAILLAKYIARLNRRIDLEIAQQEQHVVSEDERQLERRLKEQRRRELLAIATYHEIGTGMLDSELSGAAGRAIGRQYRWMRE